MTEIVSPGLWADPRVWLIAAGILVIVTIILIYYKVFTGEKKP